MLDLEKTLWVGVKFCVANDKMAQDMHTCLDNAKAYGSAKDKHHNSRTVKAIGNYSK